MEKPGADGVGGGGWDTKACSIWARESTDATDRRCLKGFVPRLGEGTYERLVRPDPAWLTRDAPVEGGSGCLLGSSGEMSPRVGGRESSHSDPLDAERKNPSGIAGVGRVNAPGSREGSERVPSAKVEASPSPGVK